MLSMRREVVSEVHHLVVGEADAVDRAGDEPGDDVVAREADHVERPAHELGIVGGRDADDVGEITCTGRVSPRDPGTSAAHARDGVHLGARFAAAGLVRRLPPRWSLCMYKIVEWDESSLISARLASRMEGTRYAEAQD